MSGVAILFGQGQARVAGQSYDIAPGAGDGAVRLLPDGPELRPLRFGERARLARSALRAEHPAEELAQAVLGLAQKGQGSHPAGAAIALHLAGAGASDVGFAAAQSLLARQLGWTQSDVAEAPASDVDALADQWQKSMTTVQDGWTKFVFGGPAVEEGETPQAVALSLAEDLLNRASAGLDPALMPPVAEQPIATPQPDATSVAPPNADPQHPAEPVSMTGKSATNAGEQATASRSPAANPTPHPSPRLARSVAPSVAGNPQHITTQSQTVATPSPAEIHAAAPQTAERPDPFEQKASRTHPAAQSGLLQAPGSARPLGRDAAPDSRNIWAPRPPLAEKPQRSKTAKSAEPQAPVTLPPFSGWFDEPRQAQAHQGTTGAAPAWVWGPVVTDQPAVPIFDDAAMPPEEDLEDAIARSLHLAADLRGIAP